MITSGSRLMPGRRLYKDPGVCKDAARTGRALQAKRACDLSGRTTGGRCYEALGMSRAFGPPIGLCRRPGERAAIPPAPRDPQLTRLSTLTLTREDLREVAQVRAGRGSLQPGEETRERLIGHRQFYVFACWSTGRVGGGLDGDLDDDPVRAEGDCL
jgi:hypothetical protein